MRELSDKFSLFCGKKVAITSIKKAKTGGTAKNQAHYIAKDLICMRLNITKTY